MQLPFGPDRTRRHATPENANTGARPLEINLKKYFLTAFLFSLGLVFIPLILILAIPKIGDYDLNDAQGHYAICLRPVDENARLCNLLLTMLQRMDVEIESFGDSLATIPEILA